MKTIDNTDQPVAGGFTLANLMLCMCFVMPFSGGTGFSKAGHCGAQGFFVALLVGLPLGLIFAYLMYKAFEFSAPRLPATGGWWLTVPFLLACFCWLAFAGAAGGMAEELFFPKQSAYLKACRAAHTCLTSQGSTR